MTSGGTFPSRFTKVDDLTRPHHHNLTPDDTCYFLGEYTARRGYAFSATNDLIINLKKPMDRRGRSEWGYKQWAIQRAAESFRNAISPLQLDAITFVPVPPSKAKTDPLYDDRLLQMLHLIRPAPPLDIRELIIQNSSMNAAHESDDRPSQEELESAYVVDKNLLHAPKATIAVVDDLLTTGTHFRAMKAVILRELPDTHIVGLFIARRAPDTSEFDEVEASSNP